MSNNLILCNSVYQVFIALWIKYDILAYENTDIIISNHMNDYEVIADNLSDTKLFEKIYKIKSKEYVYRDFGYKNQAQRLFYKSFPELELKKIINLDKKYDCFYFANFDEFSKLAYNVLKRKNENLKVNIYSDGISTQSKLFEGFYKRTASPKSKYYKFLNSVLRRKYLYGNISKVMVFEPDLMEWDPGCKVEKIKPVGKNSEFIKIVNQVFGYDSIKDEYSEKYIFFEESFYADSGYMEDVELIEKLAETVGKDNLMIKIHPRNPKNRFKELGYKTNKDTSVPWEVIAMNIDLSDKKLIAIASTSILNPIQVLGMNVKSYSLINCLNEVPKLLDSPLSQTVLNMYSAYPENIKICESLDDIVK